MRETKMKKVLVVVLALAMVFAMNITAFAGEDPGTWPTPTLKLTEQEDGTVLVEVSVDGDLEAFDYGIAYDADKVTVKSIGWNSEFSAAYSEEGVLGREDMGKLDGKGTYVSIGGTFKNGFAWSGLLFKVVIEPKTAGDIGNIVIVKDAGTYAKANTDKLLTAALAISENLTTGKTYTYADVTPLVNETETPGTETPGTETPGTETPGTETTAPVSATTAPVSATTAPASATTAPASATTAPTTAPASSNSTKSAKTGDTASVVIPVIAICAAAAAVVVASKKRVEE